jgi:hypothetical protein
MTRKLLLALFVLLVCSAAAVAQTIQTGEFTAAPDKEGYSLQGGTGDRTYIEDIVFEKPFTVPPRVLVSLSGYDATAGPDNTIRVHVSAFRVTKTGFTLRVKTWGEGRVGSVWGGWIAVGAK